MKRTDENHSFNIHVANTTGIEKAILLKEVYGWCGMNLANKKNIHYGAPWTYNSAKALAEKFPYMGKNEKTATRNISRWLDELQKDGWLLSANFNKAAFDKTRWYTIFWEKYDCVVRGEDLTESVSARWEDLCITIGKIIQSVGKNKSIGRKKSDNGLEKNVVPIPSPTHLLPSPSFSSLYNSEAENSEIPTNATTNPTNFQFETGAVDVTTLNTPVKGTHAAQKENYLKGLSQDVLVLTTLTERMKLTVEQVLQIAEGFATDQINKEAFLYPAYKDFKSHFYHWLLKQNAQSVAKKYLKDESTNSDRNSGTGSSQPKTESRAERLAKGIWSR